MNYSVLSKYRSELMGAAMLWVILFHSWGLDLRFDLLNSIRSNGFGGVDIFIIMSAMGLVMSLSRKEQKFIPFMARRVARILPAYYVVMIPYTIFLILRRTAPLSALFWNSTLLSYWVQAEGRFNWYISGILFFFVLTPICFRRMKQSKHRVLLTAVGVAAGLLLCHGLIRLGNWNYLDVAYRIPVFFLGLLVGFFVQDDRHLGKKDVLFWCFWGTCGLLYFVVSSQLQGTTPFLPQCHLFLFTTVPMCLAGCLLFERLPLGWLCRFLHLIGESSLEIYLLNVSIFAEHTFLQQYLGVPSGHYMYYLITIPLNVLLGFLLHWMIERIMGRCVRSLS